MAMAADEAVRVVGDAAIGAWVPGTAFAVGAFHG